MPFFNLTVITLYRGTYKLQPCAIKLIFTVDLTVDVIARVAAEARILSFVKVIL